ncbi:hypothetical protein C8J57DRAFT_1628799 [Mycena rebaudengoi]|nr:hypothetical protein C8J57DRAFT_1628799 [Mycena rebaudengoi]
MALVVGDVNKDNPTTPPHLQAHIEPDPLKAYPERRRRARGATPPAPQHRWQHPPHLRIHRSSGVGDKRAGGCRGGGETWWRGCRYGMTRTRRRGAAEVESCGKAAVDGQRGGVAVRGARAVRPSTSAAGVLCTECCTIRDSRARERAASVGGTGGRRPRGAAPLSFRVAAGEAAPGLDADAGGGAFWGCAFAAGGTVCTKSRHPRDSSLGVCEGGGGWAPRSTTQRLRRRLGSRMQRVSCAAVDSRVRRRGNGAIWGARPGRGVAPPESYMQERVDAGGGVPSSSPERCHERGSVVRRCKERRGCSMALATGALAGNRDVGLGWPSGWRRLEACGAIETRTKMPEIQGLR